mgnify:CR=1 FL=1
MPYTHNKRRSGSLGLNCRGTMPIITVKYMQKRSKPDELKARGPVQIYHKFRMKTVIISLYSPQTPVKRTYMVIIIK